MFSQETAYIFTGSQIIHGSKVEICGETKIQLEIKERINLHLGKYERG